MTGDNSLLTIGMITREAVRLWRNSNAFVRNMDMQYDDRFAESGAKIGNQLQIRIPNDYIVRNGPNLEIQETNEQSITLVVAIQRGVDVAFSTVDRAMSLDDYSERVLAPGVNNLAGNVAATVMGSVEGGICNAVANTSSAGTLLSPGSSQWLTAGALLNNNSAPLGNRKAVQSPISEARIVAALSGLFNPQSQVGEQYVTGRMYDALGLIWMQDQTVLLHTNGTFATTNTVSGAGQTGYSLTVNALTGTLAAGDIITIPGVYAVNRITKQNSGLLRQFVVTSAVGNGATTIPIYPAIVGPDANGNPVAYQTVTAAPANGAAINLFLGASTQYTKNFAFCKEAVTLATADLEIPGGVHEAARETYDGISMRMITDYIINTDQMATRLDILFGYLWLRPEWACIVADTLPTFG